MDYKNLQGAFVRRQEIVCTEAEASLYGSAVLLEGEPIYIKMNDGSIAQKLGDGKTKLKDLPFTDFGKEKVEAAAEAALAEIADAKEALLDDIAVAGEIVQTTGNSETAVMSQKAVTEEGYRVADESSAQRFAFKKSEFKYGSISWNGEVSDSSRRIMFTQNKQFDYPVTLSIKTPSAYRFMVHYFDDGGVWSQWVFNEWLVDDFTIPANQEFNVVVGRVDDGAATIDDLCGELYFTSQIRFFVESHEKQIESVNNYIQTSAYRVYPTMTRKKYFSGDGLSIVNNSACAINDGFIDIRNAATLAIPAIPNIAVRALYYNSESLEDYVYDKYHEAGRSILVDVSGYNYLRIGFQTADKSSLTQELLNTIMQSFALELTTEINPHTNRERIESIEKSISETRTAITVYEEEEMALYKKVRENIDSKTLVFGCIADNHYNDGTTLGKNAVERAKEYRLICENIGCDFVSQLGDIAEEDDNDISITIDRVNKMSRALRGHIPFVYAIGHHECRPGMGQDSKGDSLYAVSQSRIYALTTRFTDYLNVSHYSRASDSNSYYFDVDDRKIRVIVLDSISRGQKGFTEEVLSFLDEALENTNGYGVILLAHVATRKEMNTNNYGVSNGTLVESKLNAFVENGGKILAYIHGHTHFDNVVREPDMKFTNIAICCAKPIRETIKSGVLGNPQNYERVIGKYSEHCFDIICVHTDTNKINLFRFGAGADRVVEV